MKIRESSNQKDSQISQLRRNILLKQTIPTLTKTELALGALLSIFAYTIFWILGISLGQIIPGTVIIFLGSIFLLVRKKIERSYNYRET